MKHIWGKTLLKRSIKNIRAIGLYIKSGYHYGVNAESDIYSIADLSDKRIAAGVKGSGTELAFMRLLAEYGITYDSIRAAGGSVQFLGYGEGRMALKDRAVDVAIFDNPAPDPDIVEIELAFPVRVLNIEEDVLARMAEKYGYGTWVVPGGAYKGTPEEAHVMTVANMLSVRAGLSEDLVYRMTYALYENLERLEEIFAQLGLMDFAASATGIPIPFHPGAEKYWKEKGML